jgi:hypothetical protein
MLKDNDLHQACWKTITFIRYAERQWPSSGMLKDNNLHQVCFFQHTWWRSLSFSIPDEGHCLSAYLMKVIVFQHTWWRLFQKRVLATKLDIYVFNKLRLWLFFLDPFLPSSGMLKDNNLHQVCWKRITFIRYAERQWPSSGMLKDNNLHQVCWKTITFIRYAERE